MDQTSPTIPPEAQTQGQQGGPAAETAAAEQPGFGSRGRIRRRARFLRRARELAYRDLGGLVFNLHRFGERNDSLVLAKLSTLSHIDTELRTLERALGDRRPITVLREAGITACPPCAAIHGSEDRFCPNCGLPLSRNVDLPIGAASPAPPASTAAPAAAAQPPAAPAAAPNQPAGGAPAPTPEPPPSPAPQPAAPAAGERGETPPGGPATQSMPAAAAAPAGGRAPVPPARASGPADASPVEAPSGAVSPAAAQAMRSRGPEDVTEILHPPTPGQ